MIFELKKRTTRQRDSDSEREPASDKKHTERERDSRAAAYLTIKEKTSTKARFPFLLFAKQKRKSKF